MILLQTITINLKKVGKDLISFMMNHHLKSVISKLQKQRPLTDSRINAFETWTLKILIYQQVIVTLWLRKALPFGRKFFIIIFGLN